MKIKTKINSFILLALGLFFSLSNTVLAANSEFTLFGKTCNNKPSPIECWIKQIFDWSRVTMYSVALIAIIFGGIVYMTSAGNPQSMARAKKIILGAFTGIAIIILADFFLTYVLGVNG